MVVIIEKKKRVARDWVRRMGHPVEYNVMYGIHVLLRSKKKKRKKKMIR